MARNSAQHRFDGASGGWGSRAAMPWWKRVFAQGDNPLTWALPVGRVAGISVRVSVIYLVWMAMELARAESLLFKGWMVGALFVIILLHEFGHCIACRLVKGEADGILMWMLGGLASCRPPHRWQADFITTAGGPLVNVALIPVLSVGVLASGMGMGALWFNPLNIQGSVPLVVPFAWWKLAIWLTYVTNWLLLLFNVLVPMFPLDGGRLVQALIWRRLGYSRSMWIATTIGLATAVVLGLVAIFIMQRQPGAGSSLLGIAIFGGITCFFERHRYQFTRTDDSWNAEHETGFVQDDPERQRRVNEAATRQAETDELDRILAKIKAKGMGSLTKSEESFLRTTTARRQGR